MASERIMPRQLRSGRGKQRNHTRCNSRYLNSNKDAVAEEWGPSGSQASPEGPGNQNLRTALLTNNEPANRDRRKGRLPSLEDHEVAVREPDSEEVLVYVHKVQPTDTLAGVLLAYDIEPGALRKANRLWPNDSIQMRSQLYLPVGDCAVKGTPLLADGLEEQSAKPRETNSGNNSQQQANTFPDGGVQVTNLKASHGHHSFVQIDPIGSVEIVRLARPKLSHFPSPSGDRPQLKPRIQDHSPPVELQYKRHPPDISTDTFERLEVVGAAIETFVRRVAASARTNWVNKTTNDLIELTSQIGRLPQSADLKEPSVGNGRNTNSHRREEATSASSATSNSIMVLSDTTPEAPRSRRRTKRADPSEG
ncbi:hypothetical protein TWF730_004104 [Orbilia blumenaviensis]|uniref:LysM domain-containing protein n=1 Tax=Orbilia blumenaviensis TaxID=1796055 RepID=A0AAV9U5W4_9PEZI